MIRRLFDFVAAVSIAAAFMVPAVHAAVVNFGSGTNVFQIDFVTIGNPGNAPDTDPNARPISATLGRVGYTYGIGKFEVSEGMLAKFNASQSLQITMSTRGVNKPATEVSWNEAARFVNWLNTITGNQVAYKFTSGGVNDNIALWTSADTLDYDPLNPYRSKRATYVLPSYNEWYKAAYYNPSNSTYYDFPNGSNTTPTAVATGTAVNTAVYGKSGPADVDQAGGLSLYGVMGLGGNVWEWDESSGDLLNSSGSSPRGIRGGYWGSFSNDLSSSVRDPFNPSSGSNIGFRVASVTPSSPPAVPEPSMMVIGTLFSLAGLAAKRRMKK